MSKVKESFWACAEFLCRERRAPRKTKSSRQNDTPRQIIDPVASCRSLSGNGQRQLRGCRPLVQGLSLRCSGAEFKAPRSSSEYSKVAETSPVSLSLVPTVKARDGKCGGTGLQKAKAAPLRPMLEKD